MIVIEQNDEALEDFCPNASLSYCFRFQISSSTYQHSVDDGCHLGCPGNPKERPRHFSDWSCMDFCTKTLIYLEELSY